MTARHGSIHEARDGGEVGWRLRRHALVAVGATAVALVVTVACSSSGGANNGGGGGGPAATTGGGGGPAATTGGGGGAPSIDTSSFKIAWNSPPDAAALPALMAISDLKKQGYNISVQTLNGADATFQALSTNQIQLTENNPTDGAFAVDKGAPVKVFIEMSGDEVAWVAAPGFEDCAKLSGKPVGIFAQVSGYTSLMKLYFSKHCADVKPNYVVIPDSGLRAQALGAGRIDGSALAITDAYNMQAKNPDKKFLISPINPEFPGIAANYLYTNDTTLKDHPSILTALSEAEIKAVRQIYANPGDFATLLKDNGLGQYAKSAKTFIKDKIWSANGGDLLGGLKATYPVEDLPGDPAKMVDDTILKAALAKIGRSSATKN